MAAFFKAPGDIDMSKRLDEIANAVYQQLKPLGFRKHSRTLHRFVSGDISQVIHFQRGKVQGTLGKSFCVNLGIRIPESAERVFELQSEPRKFYHEYECNIRSRLGVVSGKGETWFDLRKNPERTAKRIITELERVVIPVFDILNSRDAVLEHRREYPMFDQMNSHLILLEESMIYGRRGELEKARELFDAYYRSKVNEYNADMKQGRKIYLKKGERVVFLDQNITAQKDGFVTLYGANHGHIDYLDGLAAQLGLR